MSWLNDATKRILEKQPPEPFAPNLIFGFDEVHQVIQIAETAIDANIEESRKVGSEAVMRAAANPMHSFVEEPVFTPMAAGLWDAEMTFPVILRRALFIAICSHVEHVLRRWCRLLHATWSLKQDLKALKKNPKESDLHHCLRYLRDEATLAIVDFEQWPEWSRIDAYRVARNRLAHDGGIVEDADERKKLAALPFVEVDDSGILLDDPVIHLLPGACEAG